MAEPELLGSVLSNVSKSGKCEHCRLRFRDGEQPWCARCIKRYVRRGKHSKAKHIKLVGELYVEADLSHLEKGIPVEAIMRKPEYQDVFFYGAPGTGKTYAFAAFIKYYRNLGFECARINFDEFCCDVRAAYSPASKVTEKDITDLMKMVDVLFIDDLGLRTKVETDFVYVTMFTILNKRQERLLPTFISSNKSLAELSKTLFDDRILSRLSNAIQVEVKGKDRRKG